jgi:poly [ADP-ribose] polymerase
MDEEKPEVFTVSVGNLPPKCDALIKITYVTELEVRALARQYSSERAC